MNSFSITNMTASRTKFGPSRLHSIEEMEDAPNIKSDKVLRRQQKVETEQR